MATFVVGCGAGSGSDTAESPEATQTYHELGLTLDGETSPEAAGLLTASHLDYFADAGLWVDIYNPLDPTRPVQYVAERRVDIAVSHEPQVLLAQEKGAPVVAVGSLVPKPTMAMIWLPSSKIGNIADLKGKTIAVPGVPFQKLFLETVLGQAGLKLSDVTVKRVDYELVPALVDGRADAIFGGSWNVEGAELESLKLKPVITKVTDLGVPPYNELVVIARRDRVAKNPELFRDFMQAVDRGTVSALEDPGMVLEAIAATNYGAPERKWMEAGVEATLPLLSETSRIDSGQTSDLIAWMHQKGILARELPASTLTAP